MKLWDLTTVNDYYEKSLKIERKRILNNKGIKIDTYDLRNPDEMNSFMDENKPDVVGASRRVCWCSSFC